MGSPMTTPRGPKVYTKDHPRILLRRGFTIRIERERCKGNIETALSPRRKESVAETLAIVTSTLLGRVHQMMAFLAAYLVG